MNLLTKTKLFIKEMKLTTSDFFFLFGFIFSIPFYAFAWKFMVTTDPSTIFFNNQMIITCFLVTICCWGAYFYFEIKEKRIRNHLFTWVYVGIAILSVIAVLVQKTTTEFMVECKATGSITESLYPGTKIGDIVKVTATLSPTHRLFFTCATLVITTFIYIDLVVIPQRIKTMDFLVLIGVITMVFMLGMSVYSYISESSKYIPFLKAFWVGDGAEMKRYAMASFVVSSVPYGACMMLAFMFALLVHEITQKHYWYVALSFFYINMLFSYCRTSIAITSVILFLYVTYRLIITFKRHKIRNIIAGSIFYLSILTLVAFNIASYATKGSFAPMMYKHIEWFFNTRTLDKRKYIWSNIQLELKGGWLIIGRGFGTHNYMLYPMNLLNNDNVCPSHSTYYAILGAGGLISLFAFFGLIAYYIVIFIKCFKVSKTMPIGLSFGIVGFLAYSFTEGVNYLIVASTFPLILYYNIYRKNMPKNNN